MDSLGFAKVLPAKTGRMGGKLVRCKGIIRTTLNLHLKAAAYNLKRLVFLKESGLKPF